MTTVADRKVSRAAWAILAAMGFGALIAQMFSTVIGPALPTIKDDLGLGLSAQTWTITAYSLAFGAALVAGGRMGDLVGEVGLSRASVSVSRRRQRCPSSSTHFHWRDVVLPSGCGDLRTASACYSVRSSPPG